eukprot:4813122-Amphidinium_carterae.1
MLPTRLTYGSELLETGFKALGTKLPTSFTPASIHCFLLSPVLVNTSFVVKGTCPLAWIGVMSGKV